MAHSHTARTIDQPSLRKLQARDAARIGGECIGGDPQSLQHADVHARQRRIALPIKCQILPVPETTAGQSHRQIGGIVSPRMTRVPALQHHRTLQQPRSLCGRRLPLPESFHELVERSQRGQVCEITLAPRLTASADDTCQLSVDRHQSASTETPFQNATRPLILAAASFGSA